MPANGQQAPIVVNPSSLPTLLAAGLRYLISVGGTAAVSLGWVNPENVEGIGAKVFIACTIAYGLYKTFRNHGKLVEIADAAPPEVARLK